MAARSDADRRAAIESMARVRAVESPPEPDGTRSIWHQGKGGADLVTTVNAQGVVTHHALTLFDDHVEWSRDDGVRTGTVTERRSDPRRLKVGDLELDHDEQARKDRLGRVGKALDGYAGEDKFVLSMRNALTRARAVPLDENVPVTRSSDKVLLELVKAETARQEAAAALEQAKKSRSRVLWAAGALLLAAAVAALLTAR